MMAPPIALISQYRRMRRLGRGAGCCSSNRTTASICMEFFRHRTATGACAVLDQLPLVEESAIIIGC